MMIHIPRRLGAFAVTDHLGRYARNRGARRDIFQYHAARADLGAFANFDVAEDLGTGADQYALAHLGVTITRLEEKLADDSNIAAREDRTFGELVAELSA